ncbi:MAG: response regulator transcription factor [Anaerolineae bacterium]|nr:response regulator transcription factor [Anaerolineae bacterium]
MSGNRVGGLSPRVLVVDDEADVRWVLRIALEEWGYRVDEVASGEEALSRIATYHYDLLLLDLRMPGIDGVGVMERVRLSHPNLPIVILTGYATLESAIAAVRYGAADYLLKPVSIREIARAVRKALQRSVESPQQGLGMEAETGDGMLSVLKAGPLALDLGSRRLTILGEQGAREVDLTPVEAAVLACLMRSPGEVVTYSALAREVWNLPLDPGHPKDVIRVVIHRLRRKIEVDPRHPALIRTVFGKGYLLEVGGPQKL